LEDVLFSQGCLESYGRRYARGVTGAALNERLREEILRKGYVMRDDLPSPSEFARLRVPHRFDVILKTRPTAEHPVTVNGLYFPATSINRNRKQRKRGKQRRRAA
jgi:hypothetical protein